jgi:hypothetical protein
MTKMMIQFKCFLAVSLMSALPLCMAETPAPADFKQSAGKSDALPSVDDILSKYIEACGGRAALDKISSRVIKGTIESAMMPTPGQWELHTKAPNKTHSKVDLSVFGLMVDGFDGKVAWSKNPFTGLVEKTGDELEKTKRDAIFKRELSLKSTFPDLINKGLQKVGEADAYLLESKPTATSLEQFYISAKTFLCLRQNSEYETSAGRIQSETLFEDMRDVDGIKVPFSIRIQLSIPSQPVLSMTIKCKDIKHDGAVDDALFQKPAAP